MPLNERDIERLSAYLDNALDDADRAQVEARLQTDPEFRRELERLRATVALIRDLPTLSAPRDLRLTRKMIEPPRVLMFPATPIFSMVSAAAAIVLFLAGIILVSTAQPQTVAPQVVFAPTQTVMATVERFAAQPTQTLATSPEIAAELFMQEEEGDAADAVEAPASQPTLSATTVLEAEEADQAEAAGDTGLADEEAGAAAGAGAADEAAEAAPESARSAVATTTPESALQFAPEEPGAAELRVQPTETAAPTLAPTVTAVPTPEALQTEVMEAADNSLAGVLLIAIAALLLILSGAAAVRGRRA